LIIIAAISIVCLSLAAVKIRLLTYGGGGAATIIGLAALFLGGMPALMLLFLFFCTSNLLGLWRKNNKQELQFEKSGQRDQWQVLANGGPAVLGLVAGALFGGHAAAHESSVLLFAAGLAEATADTWATEIGSAAEAVPRSIVTGIAMRAGQSGGISVPGTLAAAMGSTAVGFACVCLTRSSNPMLIGLGIAVSGLAGSLVDSVLGATIQAQYLAEDGTIREIVDTVSSIVHGVAWIRNDSVNFLAGISSLGIMAIFLHYLCR
jgi:uncharacterized protein (TIGR00297 family)